MLDNRWFCDVLFSFDNFNWFIVLGKLYCKYRHLNFVVWGRLENFWHSCSILMIPPLMNYLNWCMLSFEVYFLSLMLAYVQILMVMFCATILLWWLLVDHVCAGNREDYLNFSIWSYLGMLHLWSITCISTATFVLLILVFWTQPCV